MWFRRSQFSVLATTSYISGSIVIGHEHEPIQCHIFVQNTKIISIFLVHSFKKIFSNSHTQSPLTERRVCFTNHYRRRLVGGVEKQPVLPPRLPLHMSLARMRCMHHVPTSHPRTLACVVDVFQYYIISLSH